MLHIHAARRKSLPPLPAPVRDRSARERPQPSLLRLGIAPERAGRARPVPAAALRFRWALAAACLPSCRLAREISSRRRVRNDGSAQRSRSYLVRMKACRFSASLVEVGSAWPRGSLDRYSCRATSLPPASSIFADATSHRSNTTDLTRETAPEERGETREGRV